MAAWALWCSYKKERDNFQYKPIGLQAALNDLAKISGGSEETAIDFIKFSISKNYAGIYPRKSLNNGTKQQNSDFSSLANDAINHIKGDKEQGDKNN